MNRSDSLATPSKRPRSTLRAPAWRDAQRPAEARVAPTALKPAARQPRFPAAAREPRVRRDPWHIMPAGNRSPAYLAAKRVFDLVVATALLVLLSPLLLATLLVLTLTTRGRPLYAQQRLGFLGRPFRLYKFRTMVRGADRLRCFVENEQDGPIFKNHADPRITRVGRLLRKTSIDELPQLFNVLRGDMSLVGPRPPLFQEVLQYTPLQRKRLSVQPGLTCLWQVSGRSEIGFARWMQMDLWYVKHQDLLTDLVLLLRTPQAVISRRGAH